MIHDDPPFIYIHIPKTGGSSIERAIKADVRWDSELGIDKPFHIRRDLITREDEPHLPARVFKQSFPETFERSFTFGFVRNSWDYTVSAYHWLAKYRELTLPFDEWVRRKFRGTPKREWNIFMKPCQLDWITDRKGNVIVDFVGRFERIQSDWDDVFAKLGMERIELPHLNRSEGRKPYPEYYDSKTQKLVAKHFRRDIEHFGFGFGDAAEIP